MDRLVQGGAAMDLDERKARLLRAVVHEFIYTEKPVGS
jgi:transcriptional regulator of heat shock response